MTERTVVDRLFEQVSRDPAALALTDGTRSLSFGQLWSAAASLAGLMQAAGHERGRLVVVFGTRGLSVVVGELAAWLAGSPALLVDAGQPTERAARILTDSNPGIVVLADTDVQPALAAPVPMLDVEDIKANPEPPAGLGPLPTPDDPAYLIYTSGSTGLPKGVLVGHRSLAALIDWHVAKYQVHPGERVSSVAAITFDAFVWEIWPNLTAGASVHFAPAEVKFAPWELGDWYHEEDVTVSFLPTPMAESFVRDGTHPEQLRHLLTGGDRLRLPDGHELRSLVNHYGPTEATVVTTAAEVPNDETGAIPIGEPIPPATVAIVDETGHPVEPGMPGELVVGGDILSLGYWQDPALTDKKFGELPAVPAEADRWYHTGDLVLEREDHQLVYLGRLDRQIKVRGVRIEPGEIEAALASHPEVADAVVELDANSQELRAFYTAPTEAEPDLVSLRQHVSERLPAEMIPTQFERKDEIPLTPHGKVDRAALLDGDREPTE